MKKITVYVLASPLIEQEGNPPYKATSVTTVYEGEHLPEGNDEFFTSIKSYFETLMPPERKPTHRKLAPGVILGSEIEADLPSLGDKEIFEDPLIFRFLSEDDRDTFLAAVWTRRIVEEIADEIDEELAQ